jgi:hypothetical protein
VFTQRRPWLVFDISHLGFSVVICLPGVEIDSLQLRGHWICTAARVSTRFPTL